jgi:hypothetical protein
VKKIEMQPWMRGPFEALKDPAITKIEITPQRLIRKKIRGVKVQRAKKGEK